MQAFFWISLIKKRVKLPLSPQYYHLLTPKNARITYGVDHSTYASTLAKDIGCAPGLVELWRHHGTKVLVCYWSVTLTFIYQFWNSTSGNLKVLVHLLPLFIASSVLSNLNLPQASSRQKFGRQSLDEVLQEMSPWDWCLWSFI